MALPDPGDEDRGRLRLTTGEAVAAPYLPLPADEPILIIVVVLRAPLPMPSAPPVLGVLAFPSPRPSHLANPSSPRTPGELDDVFFFRLALLLVAA